MVTLLFISGLGQLRHNSNASGPSYGKRFKKDGILGCCLNMEKGTLSFALNGEYWGVAFTDNKLKEGTIYPAVSLLHCAGCKIRAGIPVPHYFKDWTIKEFSILWKALENTVILNR